MTVPAQPATATTGAVTTRSPRLPKNGVANVNTPPSAPTSQYPRPDGAGAIPTTRATNGRPPADPKNSVSP